MMKPQTHTGKVLAKMMMTAAAAAATLKKTLNVKKILRRLTLPADIAETFALSGDLYKYVNSWGCDI
jgi:hypothetical protein